MSEWDMGESAVSRTSTDLPMYIYQNEDETFVKPGAETVLTLSAARSRLWMRVDVIYLL